MLTTYSTLHPTLQNRQRLSLALAMCSVLATFPASAETPQQILDGFSTQAKTEAPDFQGFDAERGQLFFNNTHGNDWSCATCHTSNPAHAGKHVKTDKVIEPMAPAVNAQRFTDLRKVNKWFKRNCGDVLDRECTSLEKGDVLTYLMAIQ